MTNHSIAPLAELLDVVPAPRPAMVRRLAICPRCTRPSSGAGVYHEACAVEQIRETRTAALGRALSTLPNDTEWANLHAPEALIEVLSRSRQPGEVDPRDLVRAVQVARDEPWITLVGRAGSGKTLLAVAICRTILRKAMLSTCTVEDWKRAEGVRLITAHRLAFAPLEHALGEGQAPLVEEAIKATVLVIDDLCGETRTTHASPLTLILDEREKSKRQTIVTLGFDEAEVLRRYGDGASRRVFERSCTIPTGKP